MNYATLRNKVRERVSSGWATFKADARDLGSTALLSKRLGLGAALALSGITLLACPDSDTSNDKPKCEGEMCLTDVAGGWGTEGDVKEKDCNGDGCSAKQPKPKPDGVAHEDVSLFEDSAAAWDGGKPLKPDSKEQKDAAPLEGQDGVVSVEDTAPTPQEDGFGTGADSGKPLQGTDTSYPPITVDGGKYTGADTSTQQPETMQPPVVEETCGGSTVTKMFQIKTGPEATEVAVYVGGTVEVGGVAYKITAIDENSDGTVTLHFDNDQELKTQLFGTYEVTNEFEGTATYTQKVVMEAFGTTFGAVPERVVLDEKDCSTEHVFSGVISGAVVYMSLNCDQNANGTYSAVKDASGNLSVNFDAMDGYGGWVWGDANLVEGFEGVINTGTEVIIATVLVGSPVHGNPDCQVPKAGVELTYSGNIYTWIAAEGTSFNVPTTDGNSVTVSVMHAIPKVGVDAGTGVLGEWLGCATLSVKTPIGNASQTQCSFDEGAFSTSWGPYQSKVTATVEFVKVEPGPDAKN